MIEVNLYEIERQCRFYQRTRMIAKEKQLLESVLSNPKFSHWGWGIKRMKELNPNFIMGEEKKKEKPQHLANTIPSAWSGLKNYLKDKSEAYSFYLRSCIARYDDQYEEELTIIQKALSLYPADEYFLKRIAWHNLPYFDKYEARKTPILSDNYEPVAQELRDQLTIVLGGGNVAFNEIYECIESLKNTKYYHNVNIEIIDCGLTSEQKDILHQVFKVNKFHDGHSLFEKYIGKKAEECIDSNHPMHPNILVIIVLESFMPHFINSQYLWYIDSDIWIQCEEKFDRYFKVAIQYNVALTSHITNSNIGAVAVPYLQKHPYYQKLQPYLYNTNFEQAFGCYNRSYEGFNIAQKEWKDFLENYKAPIWIEYLIKNFSYRSIPLNENSILLIDFQFYGVYSHQVNSQNMIITPDQNLVGSIHFSGSPKDTFYHQPIKKILDDGSFYTVYRSLRYRDLPWKDKPKIKEILEQYIRENEISL